MQIESRIKVVIRWKAPEEGGRKMLIEGTHYRPTIVLCGDSSQQHWTFIMDFKGQASYDYPTIAEATFITNAAPWEQMFEGTQFNIHEGPKLVGYGVVVTKCVPSVSSDLKIAVSDVDSGEKTEASCIDANVSLDNSTQKE